MKHLLVILLCVQSLFVVGQNDAKRITDDSRAFMQALESGDYEHFLDMTYPQVFEIYERGVFLETLKDAMEGNTELKMEFLNTPNTVFDISEIYILNEPKAKYAFVTYPISMKLTFLNESFDKEIQDMMKMMMETEFMEIDFLNENTLLMKQKSMMIAINDEKTNNKWKYLNYDPTEFEFYNILPEELVNKAKSYYEFYLSGN